MDTTKTKTQRSIKFRVWRYCHGEKRFKYYYLNHLKIALNGGADICLQASDMDYYDDSVRELDFEEEALEQFTGLTDKNGKEIFEGDIVTDDLNRDFGEKPWAVGTQEGFIPDAFSLMADIMEREAEDQENPIEVIGNIHQNPKLLK